MTRSLGYVGTRTMAHSSPVADTGANRYRFPFYAADDLSGVLSVAFSNWYGDEVTDGNVLTVLEAYFEDPAGALTPITFGGAPMTLGGPTSAVAAAKTNLWGSWNIPGTIAAGSKCYLRYCLQGTVSRYWNDGTRVNVLLGEAATTGTTLTGTIPNTLVQMTRPTAIVGYTGRKTYVIPGDSTQLDVWGDGNIAAPGNMGQIARGMRDTIGYASLAVGGARAANWIAAHTLRDELILPYAWGILNGYGAVDCLVSTNTAAQVKAIMQALRALYPTKHFWQKTVDPQTSSVKNWIDASDQIPLWGAPQEAQRIIYNADLRAHPTDIGDGIIDTTVFTEFGAPSAPSGCWVFNGTPGYATVDGGHETQTLFNLLSFPGFAGDLVSSPVNNNPEGRMVKMILSRS